MTQGVVRDAHSRPAEVVAAAVASDPVLGLAPDEADRRLAAAGPNELARPAGPDYGRIALRQVRDPLVALLIGAALVSAAVGETLEAGVIVAIVLLNATFGFVQSVRAERAVQALRSETGPRAVVIRAGAPREIPAREVVTGDVLRVREGDRVAADARVLLSLGLEADESALTGESVPVGKGTDPVSPDAPLAERSSLVYAGTGITRGAGAAVVVATGRDTEQGVIAALTAEAHPPPTPLERKLSWLAGRLVAVGVVITVILAAAMVLQGESLDDAFLLGVSVAVAAVPEGLAATVTIALALGAREMARRGAVVRSLSAIEAIGEATVICADKTGTLTENRLRVERVEPANGCSRERVLQAARVAAAAEIDPVDRALVEAAEREGVEGGATLVHSIPFESSRRSAAVVVRDHAGIESLVVKGAPEVVLARSPASDGEAERLAEVAAQWSREGLRVLAIGARELDGKAAIMEADLETGVHPLGLVGLADPLRPEAAESIAEARREGLDVRMLTGDHPGTAHAIGQRLGLSEDEIVARCTPAEKLALVESLEDAGEIVVVTGDGVNDAPALRRAHVGIAMGRGGAEAAREASSIVLTNDDFSTIVAAIREGRRIAGNVRSFLAFLLSANVGEVILFAIAVLAGLGAPMTVVQVLTVNLVTDGAPAVALAVDPGGAAGFRPGSGALLGRGLVSALLVVGTAVGAAALAAFLLVPELQPGAGQTAAYATVALAELVFVFSCRSDRVPAWRLPRNRHLETAVLASLGVLAATIYVPALREPFGTVALEGSALLAVLGLAVVPAVAAEVAKAVRARRLR